MSRSSNSETLMLTLQSITGPADSREIFAKFDPIGASWIVSDLKSKLDLQKRLLAERTFVPGESVVRASELWRMILSRVRPDLQVVSREFVLTLIAHKLASSELDWARSPGATQAAFDYMTQLMPILSHPDGEEMTREWLKANPATEARWGRWLSLSIRLWKEFLDDGFVAAAWATGVLVNEASLTDVWNRPLFVDLGAELDQVEADLIVQLAERLDIVVLRPEPEWAGEYKRALVAYEIFERKLKVGKIPARTPSRQRPPPVHRRYTTMIAEVKDAVALVRKWLDAGAVPREVAIVAPDIEAYWPPLSSYLEQEGIPFQKDRVRRLHTYPDIARWLSLLRLRTGAFDESDVELALFDGHEARTERMIGFERFKVLYSTLYGREDIERSQPVAKKFSIELRPEDEAVRDDFVAWSLKQLPENAQLDRVEKLFKRLFTECPQSLSLTVRRWMGFLEQLAARVECPVKDGDPNGIACVGLSSAEHSPATKMIVLGLTEPALRPSGGTAILFSDVASLADQFGFHLSSDDQASLEFEARWVIEDPTRASVLSNAETDFAGAVQAASWIWVRSARQASEHERLSIPEPTRWDEIQYSSIETIAESRGWSPAQRELAEQTLREDLGELSPETYGAELVESLSPSAIEDYLKCPFIFAVKRLFGLSDVAELDLQVDASRRGSLMHKLFEILTIEPIRFDLSEEELGAVVERAREASHLELADDRMWPSLRARHLDLARRFLAFEREYRARFKDVKTIAREADIAGFLAPESGELTREKNSDADLKFVGRIDRVDSDDRGNLAIYDYKSSLASVSQYGSWLKNNRIQLLLYALAVENGLTSFDAKPVVSAMYYVAKPFTRDYGFKVEDVEQGLYELGDRRKRNKIKSEERLRLYEQSRALIREAVGGIRAGRFAPNPRDRKTCIECQWSHICRAPHLIS